MSSSDEINRRISNFRRSINGGFINLMNNGMDLMGIGGRQLVNQSQGFHFQPALGIPIQHPGVFTPVVQEEWAFLSCFEQEYGTVHPFFYACRFADAMRIAREEKKILFIYIHYPEHPFTPNFCKETLCSEIVVEFLDTNFVCWGGLASRGEGLQRAAALRVLDFPFCAVVSPSASDDLAVLRKTEGPVSPAALIDMLQITLEDQARESLTARVEQEENRRLREEQDAAYLEALKIDQDKEKNQNKPSLTNEAPKEKASNDQTERHKQAVSTTNEPSIEASTNEEVTQILIRLPNGERLEKSFLSRDKVEEIYRFINSQGLPGIGNYRLVSSFPRKVYGDDEMGMSLIEAGLHPKASVFMEII